MTKQEFIPIDLIDPNPYQYKNAWDAQKVQEIAASLELNLASGIGTNGLLQVPAARKVQGGRYQLAFGHHRHAAFVARFDVLGDGNFQKMPLYIEDLDDLQMFEAMAQENLSRRDIGFIEEAEMYHRHMVDFHKTSPETAERFGKSEEYIRGRIMLLQLPESVKEKAREGKINVSMARDLVSVRKLIGDTGVEEAVEAIDDETFESPREAIVQAIVESNHAMRIPSGVPWLDLKKFPTKHLDPLKTAFSKEILDVVNGDVERKRQFDELMALIHGGMEIDARNFPAFDPRKLEELRTLSTPPVCSNCPFHTAFDGDHYCGLKQCFERKEKAWQKAEVEKLWQEIGIPLYVNEATDGKAVELDRWDTGDQKLFKARHEDLRLKPTTRSIWNNFEGLPHSVMLVAVGKTAEKRLARVEKVETARHDEAEARALTVAKHELINDHVRKFLWEVAAPAFEPLLDGLTNLPFGLFMYAETIICNGYYPQGVDDDDEQLYQIKGMKRKADALKRLRLLMVHQTVWQAADANLGAWQKIPTKPVMEAATRLQKHASDWEYKLPRNFATQAEQYQAALDTAMKELTREHKSKSS